HARGLRLHGLGPADLGAVRGDPRVERHVLRLEREDAKSTADQEATEPGGQHRLSGVGRGALEHERPRAPNATHYRYARASASAAGRRASGGAPLKTPSARSIAWPSGGAPRPSR